MLIPCDEVNILNTFRVMIILRLLLLLTNLHLKLLSTQGTGADKLLSTQRVKRHKSQVKSRFKKQINLLNSVNRCIIDSTVYAIKLIKFRESIPFWSNKSERVPKI